MERRKITEALIQLFEEIGFNWNPLEQEWKDNYQLLKQYFKENGDTKVPLVIQHSDRGLLCNDAQEEEKLSKERIKLLDEIEFIWEVHS